MGYIKRWIDKGELDSQNRRICLTSAPRIRDLHEFVQRMQLSPTSAALNWVTVSLLARLKNEIDGYNRDKLIER